jgi:hypothetical protein
VIPSEEGQRKADSDSIHGSQFLDEAVRLAQRGIVCLLIQGYFPWRFAQKRSEEDRSQIIGQVIELRRTIDFLKEQPEVDR